MRVHDIITIPAKIQLKPERSAAARQIAAYETWEQLPAKEKARSLPPPRPKPLTTDDFEIVPEHPQARFVQCLCDLCGIEAEIVDDGVEGDYGGDSTHAWIEVYTGLKDDSCDCIALPEFDICRSCLDTKLLPWLENLKSPQPLSLESHIDPLQAPLQETNGQTLEEVTPLVSTEDEPF
jgi:hypothetical protein